MSMILVTGAAGFIGSHAILALAEAGHSVVALDDLSTGRRWAVPAGTIFVEGDIGNAAMLRSVFAQYPVDAIMHFAGSIEVGESVAHPLAYYRNNTAGSLVLIEEAIAAGIKRIVFSSTAAVYGEPETQPIAEDSPKWPINSLWLDQADDRTDAGRCLRCAWNFLCGVALFQRLGALTLRAGQGRALKSRAI